MEIKYCNCCSLCENFHYSQMGNGYSVDGYCMKLRVEKVRSFETCCNFVLSSEKAKQLKLEVE